MTSFISIYIILGTVCLSLLSAEPEISEYRLVGSTAVLPCQLTSVDTDTPYIMWSTESEIVFERLGVGIYQDEGYEGRVDVPVEELRKGNCSLVLHDLRLKDTGVYYSYLIHYQSPDDFRTELLNRVKLSVFDWGQILQMWAF
ncbi:uncharacterized protein Hap1MRO34_001571 [Clarias gariepinus]